MLQWGMPEIAIYALIDPRTNLPFYVGKTNKPKVRLKSHRSGAGITPCAKFIREIKSEGLRPLMQTIEVCDEDVWRSREAYWVERYQRDYGSIQILNVAVGGVQEGYYFTHSDATRLRLSVMNKGHVVSQEQREKISKSLTGLKQDAATVAKRMETINSNRVERGLEPLPIYDTQAEYLASQRERSKIARRLKRRTQGNLVRGSEEWRTAISERTKIAMANLPEDSRRKLSSRQGRPAWNKGKKLPSFSEERRKLQSDNLKAYLANLTPEQRETRMMAARAARKAKLGP